ncbi:MAG: hypothetical protein QOJ29_3344 [Thermoleophilaceae bacterium]|jgi:hypothetical protein|nr:hypothetical protein [Thermoleophilaceae bacterium]
MSDLQDRYEQQLLAAARRHLPDAAASLAKPRRTRVGVVALAGAVLTASALAATRPWEPEIGNSHFGEKPASVSPTAPPANQLQLLGVLRRDQTVDDRGAAAREALRYISGSTTSGVRTASVRVLGHGAVIVPVMENSTNGDIADALCLFYPDPAGDGGAKSCFSTNDIRTGQATDSLGRHFYGLVPDGVASVLATFTDGRTVTVPVTDNYFDVSTPAASNSEPSAPIADAPQLRWLDSNGLSVEQR